MGDFHLIELHFGKDFFDTTFGGVLLLRFVVALPTISCPASFPKLHSHAPINAKVSQQHSKKDIKEIHEQKTARDRRAFTENGSTHSLPTMLAKSAPNL